MVQIIAEKPREDYAPRGTVNDNSSRNVRRVWQRYFTWERNVPPAYPPVNVLFFAGQHRFDRRIDVPQFQAFRVMRVM
jgi:hypothetical protein